MLGLDAVGHVAADALDFGAGPAAHHDLAPGDPARGRSTDDILVVHAGAVGQHREGPLRDNGQFGGGADQVGAAEPGEGAEGVVGVGDTAARVAAHDQVALRLQQAARTFFQLAQFPIVVRQFVDARFERAHFVGVVPASVLSTISLS